MRPALGRAPLHKKQKAEVLVLKGCMRMPLVQVVLLDIIGCVSPPAELRRRLRTASSSIVAQLAAGGIKHIALLQTSVEAGHAPHSDAVTDQSSAAVRTASHPHMGSAGQQAAQSVTISQPAAAAIAILKELRLPDGNASMLSGAPQGVFQAHRGP